MDGRMNIQPLKNRVHLKRIKPEAMSAGGIALLPTEENTGYAIVLGVGPDAEGVKVGDKVYIGTFNGQEMNLGLGYEEVTAINDTDILAVCEE